MVKNPKLVELEQRNIAPLLARYSLPAIVGMAAMSLYNIIDAIFIGQWCGPYAIAGMALVFPIMNLIVAVGALVGLGCAATVSISLGQGKFDRAFRLLGHCVWLSIVFSLLVGWLPLPWLHDILVLFGAEGETLQPAADFLLVVLLSTPVTNCFMNLNHVMRASGYPRKAMVSLLISMVVNVVCCPIFIYVLGWGMTGAALATTVAQATGLVWVLAHFLQRNSILHFRSGIYGVQWPLVRRVCSVGMPPCMLNIVGCVVVVAFNQLFLAYDGSLGVGAYGIVNRVIFLFVMIVLGITQGMQPIAGYNLGLGRYDRVKRVLFCAMGAATCVTLAGALIIEIFPADIVGLFAKGNDADSLKLMDIAEKGLRIMGISFAFVGSQIVIGNFFQSIGRPAMSVFLNLTRQLIFLLPSLWLLPCMLGENGIWGAPVVSDFLSIAVSYIALYLFIKRNLRHGTV